MEGGERREVGLDGAGASLPLLVRCSVPIILLRDTRPLGAGRRRESVIYVGRRSKYEDVGFDRGKDRSGDLAFAMTMQPCSSPYDPRSKERTSAATVQKYLEMGCASPFDRHHLGNDAVFNQEEARGAPH